MKKIYTKYDTVQYSSGENAYVIQDDSGMEWGSQPMVIVVNLNTSATQIVITSTFYASKKIFFTAIMNGEIYTQDILAYIALIGD